MAGRARVMIGGRGAGAAQARRCKIDEEAICVGVLGSRLRRRCARGDGAIPVALSPLPKPGLEFRFPGRSHVVSAWRVKRGSIMNNTMRVLIGQ